MLPTDASFKELFFGTANHPANAVFDVNMEEVRLAAESGCQFYQSQLEEYDGDFSPRKLLGAKVDMHKDCLSFFVLSKHQYAIDVSNGGRGLINVEPFGARFKCWKEFSFITSSKNNAARDVKSRPINMSPSSDSTLSMAKCWLKSCLQDHKKCPKPKGIFMPTRVLQIERINSKLCMRLLNTSPVSVEPYVALSYCWGRNNVVTTSKNILERHSNIELESLPAALRDAVEITEELGIGNLWIDALCIIQDNAVDKGSEIAMMPLIYSQATVTLSASRSNGVTESFLAERNSMVAEEEFDVVTELPFKSSSAKIGSVVILPLLNPPIDPLNLRGWTLQERFLSPRFLEFGTTRTRWLCPQSFEGGEKNDGFLRPQACQRTVGIIIGIFDDVCATSSTVINFDGYDSDSEDDQSLGKSKRAQNRADLDKHLQNWHRIVSAYTFRNLIFPGDRLPTLSGIAARFGTLMNDEYCAGLWKSKLTCEIL